MNVRKKSRSLSGRDIPTGLCAKACGWFVSEVFSKEKRAAWLGHCAREEWWQSGSEVAGAFPVSVLWAQVGWDILRF